MKAGDYIKLTKLAASLNPEFPTPPLATYKQGDINEGVSLPAEYWVTGSLRYDVVVGAGVFVNRDCRNGEPCEGIMQTSPIHKINEDGTLETLNSVYKLEILKPAVKPELN